MKYTHAVSYYMHPENIDFRMCYERYYEMFLSNLFADFVVINDSTTQQYWFNLQQLTDYEGVN